MSALLLSDAWDWELNEYLSDEYRCEQEEEKRLETIRNFAERYCRCKACGSVQETFVWVDEDENTYCEDCFPEDEEVKECLVEDLMEEWK